MQRYIFMIWLPVFTTISGQYFFSDEDLQKLRNRTKGMFYHAYNGYMQNAYPHDELRPLTCDGVNTWGNYSLTLVDALDTLAVIGDNEEFERVANLVTGNLNSDLDVNVSVFETNIRVVGGLLSAHLLSKQAGVFLEDGWPCKGPLLRLAESFAKRLLPAFNSRTGMPFGTVNLRHGVDPDETPETCTAAVGTYIVEFGTLSRLTGNPLYEQKALKAIYALNAAKSDIGLLGNHINVQTGKWTALDAGIGAGVDSFFEYLVKGANLLQRHELMAMFEEHLKPIREYIKHGDWYFWVNMKSGAVTLPIFQSLEAFWPGNEARTGNLQHAYGTLLNYFNVWYKYGMTPEFYSVSHKAPFKSREGYPLRPELIESIMHMYGATKDPYLLFMGSQILNSIETISKTECGYATVKDVRDHTLENRMESFFLAETVKYLYLLFDSDNFLHNTGQRGQVWKLKDSDGCLVDSGGFIFNTEAHPIDPGSLHCCYRRRKDMEDVIKVIDSLASKGKSFEGTRGAEAITLSRTSSKVFQNLTCPAPSSCFKFNVYGEIWSEQ